MIMDCKCCQLVFIVYNFYSKTSKENINNEYGLTLIANVVNLYSLFIISVAKHQKKIWRMNMDCKCCQLVFIVYNFYCKTSKEKYRE